MNLYVQIFSQCQSSEVVRLVLWPSKLRAQSLAGQIKVLEGPRLHRSRFKAIEEIAVDLASRKFNELEINYDADGLEISSIGIVVSIVGVLAVSPTCDLWFRSMDWPAGGDRTARNRRMNAKVSETALSHYNVTQKPSVLELVISIDSAHEPDVVLDAFAEWFAASLPTALASLKIFGCVDAGGHEMFVQLESNVLTTSGIRMLAKLFPRAYPELGRRFDQLHPILFGKKQVCENMGQALGRGAKIIRSRSLKDFAVLRVASRIDTTNTSQRISEWLLLQQSDDV